MEVDNKFLDQISQKRSGGGNLDELKGLLQNALLS